MIRCEITGIIQNKGHICPHPKHKGRMVGYLTCKNGTRGRGCKFFDGSRYDFCGYAKNKKGAIKHDCNTGED